MRLAHLGAFAVLSTLACGSSAPPPAPPGVPLNPPQDDPLLAMMTEPAGATVKPQTAGTGTTAEDPKAAERAKKLAEDLVKLDQDSAKEKARIEPLRKGLDELRNKDFANIKAAVNAVLKSPHRVPGNAERDAFRHPMETLTFFGIRQDMSVLELDASGGWYTEILSPLLWKKGKLAVTGPDPSGPRTEQRTLYGLRTKAVLDKAPELGDKVTFVTVGKDSWNLGEGTYDMVLAMRDAHGWHNNGKLDENLAVIFKALKPGGILGIEDHRAPKGGDPKEWAKKGYLPEEFVMERAKAAGFKFEAKSEVNANPKDTKDHPEGVWALPPTLRNGDKDKAKYVAIGESDRFTLKFTKPKK